jgi:hypothetical protein
MPNSRDIFDNPPEQASKRIKEMEKSGNVLANKDTIDKRIDICVACAAFSKGNCVICGCYLVAKIHLQQTRCPVNKW